MSHPEPLRDVDLAPRTSLELGGKAAYFMAIRQDRELPSALEFAASEGLGVRVLGGGSNIVVSDSGVAALVLSMETRGVSRSEAQEAVQLRVAAGESWDAVVELTVADGLSGIECLSGIPGKVGATPIQNVGAYGQEVSDTIVSVGVFDQELLQFARLTAGDCGFAYRDSRFKSKEPGRYIVTDVEFRLRRDKPRIVYPELARAVSAGPGTPEHVRRTVLELRRAKSMLLDVNDPNHRSCGSFFLNPILSQEAVQVVRGRFPNSTPPEYPQADGRVKLSAAWLIEHSGLGKGTRVGNVGISTRHCLSLVAHEGATSRELLAFAEHVQSTVFERSSVELKLEPVLW